MTKKARLASTPSAVTYSRVLRGSLHIPLAALQQVGAVATVTDDVALSDGALPLVTIACLEVVALRQKFNGDSYVIGYPAASSPFQFYVSSLNGFEGGVGAADAPSCSCLQVPNELLFTVINESWSSPVVGGDLLLDYKLTLRCAGAVAEECAAPCKRESQCCCPCNPTGKLRPMPSCGPCIDLPFGRCLERRLAMAAGQPSAALLLELPLNGCGASDLLVNSWALQARIVAEDGLSLQPTALSLAVLQLFQAAVFEPISAEQKLPIELQAGEELAKPTSVDADSVSEVPAVLRARLELVRQSNLELAHEYTIIVCYQQITKVITCAP